MEEVKIGVPDGLKTYSTYVSILQERELRQTKIARITIALNASFS